MNSLRYGVLLLLPGLLAALLAGCKARPTSSAPKGVDLYVQAVKAQQAGDRKLAKARLEQAVRANPNLRMARGMLGELYRADGQYEQALPHLQAAARLDSYSVGSHYNLGVVHQLLNQLEEAARAYLRALELNPRDVRSTMNLGLVYLALGETDIAVHYLNRATQLDPSHAPAWTNLGVGLDAQGNLSSAENVYHKALELDSNSTATLQNLGANLLAQGKTTEALEIHRNLVALSDAPATRRRLAETLLATGQYEPAIEQANLALKKDSRYFPALNVKAAAHIELYRAAAELDDQPRQEALRLWKRSLRLQPAQPRVVESLQRWENPGLFAN